MINNHKINQAINYIFEHLCDELTIEEVARHCSYSQYHFNRLFKEETGQSLYAFIKKVRMDQSAFRLKVERDKTITDIGLDYGYSPSNYSTVFKKHHQKSPAQFRKIIAGKSCQQAFYPNTVNIIDSFEECDERIGIEIQEDQFVIYERSIGSYHNLKLKWCAFLKRYQEYLTDDTLLLEATFDDVSITDENGCLYDICMTVDRSCSLKNTLTIPGGKFAVYHFKGYPPQIYGAYQSIFNVWLPTSSYQLDKRYGFACYREIDYKTMKMVLDLYLPIK